MTYAVVGDHRPLSTRFNEAAARLRGLGGAAPGFVSEQTLQVVQQEIARRTNQPLTQGPVVDPLLQKADDAFTDVLCRYANAVSAIVADQRFIQVHALAQAPEHIAIGHLADPALMQAPEPLQSAITRAFAGTAAWQTFPRWTVPQYSRPEEYRAAALTFEPLTLSVEGWANKLHAVRVFERMDDAAKQRRLVLALAAKVGALGSEIAALKIAILEVENARLRSAKKGKAANG